MHRVSDKVQWSTIGVSNDLTIKHLGPTWPTKSSGIGEKCNVYDFANWIKHASRGLSAIAELLDNNKYRSVKLTEVDRCALSGYLLLPVIVCIGVLTYHGQSFFTIFVNQSKVHIGGGSIYRKYWYPTYRIVSITRKWISNARTSLSNGSEIEKSTSIFLIFRNTFSWVSFHQSSMCSTQCFYFWNNSNKRQGSLSYQYIFQVATSTRKICKNYLPSP